MSGLAEAVLILVLRVFTFHVLWKGSSSTTLVISDGDVPGGVIVSQQCWLTLGISNHIVALMHAV